MGDSQNRVEPRRLKGFRDFLPDLMASRWRLIDVIRGEADQAGFRPIGTPALEYAETLLGHGEETDKQVYRFRDHGDRDVALRFDLTVPFARFVAEHQSEIPFPFKRLQIGDVWRGENTQKGRYREFGQCDLDVIGVDSLLADLEILGTFCRILARINFGPFTMAVGSRTVLSALIRRTLGELPPGAESSVLIAIDKLAKIGPAKVLDLLGQVPGARAEGGAALLALLSGKDGDGHTDLTAVRAALEDDPQGLEQLERLVRVVELAGKAAAPGVGRVRMDLSIARGLGYYTGVVFETTIDRLPGFGSICSGGRYNNLASRFMSRELAGVGGSIGLDRLLAAIEELGLVAVDRRPLIFVAVATSDAVDYAMDIVSQLRQEGFAVDVGLTPKLAAQFKHADRLGAPVVLTVGTEEREKGTFSLKRMADGSEERGLPRAQLLAVVKDWR